MTLNSTTSIMNLTETGPFTFPEGVQVALKPDGWTILSSSLNSIVSSILQIRLSFLLLGCFVLAAVYTTKKQSNSLYFTHLDGRKMRMFPHDTRYLRFTHGYGILICGIVAICMLISLGRSCQRKGRPFVAPSPTS